MHLKSIIALLLVIISCQGLKAGNVADIDSLFGPVLSCFPHLKNDIDSLPKQRLPDDVVFNRLVQIRNKDTFDGRKLCYDAIARVNYNGETYLMYDASDGYNYEVFICPLSAEAFPPTLRIYYSLCGLTYIDFRTDNDIIYLTNYVRNYEFVYEIYEEYRLSPSFPLVNRIGDIIILNGNDDVKIEPIEIEL